MAPPQTYVKKPPGNGRPPIIKPIDLRRVVSWMQLLVEPGQVVELRALGVQRGTGRPHTEAGFYDTDHLTEMVKTALAITPHAKGVYWTINPLNSEILARKCNRTDWAESGQLAADKDVIRRRRLLIDVDPIRDPQVSATDQEKALALETTQKVRDYLREDRGWPDPVLLDSGNGYHLIYAINLPDDDAGLVKRVLAALAQRFDASQVKIDQAVYNPARICKLPGTLARKGDSTPDRPHRRAYLMETPGRPEVVPRAKLELLAAEAPAPDPPPHAGNGRAGSGEYQSRLMVDRWLAARGVGFRVKAEPDAKGRTVYVLKACPFDPGHGDPDSCIMQAGDGQLSARCLHNSCASRNWHDFKEAIGPPDPEHWDPPLPKGRATSSHNNTAAPSNGRPAGATPVLTELSKVTTEPIRWLWPNRIPRGAISILDGDPGLGKSAIAIDLTARVSRGLVMPPAGGPDQVTEPGGVLILSAEDDLARTIRPRLDAAGADVSKVLALEAIRLNKETLPPVLPQDVGVIEAIVRQRGIALVIIDPVMAYLDGTVNSHKDSYIRRCLHALAEMAKRTNVAVLLIRHLNKLAGVTTAIYRGGGSIGIIGAARSGLLAAKKPQAPGTYVLATTKCNLGPSPRALEYSIEPAGEVARIAWGGESDLTADDLLDPKADRTRQNVGDQAAEVIILRAAQNEALSG